VAQGLGFYNLNEATAGNELTSKERFSLIVNFPDLDPDIGLSPEVIDDLLNAGPESSYKLECVSPLGFFSEIYNFNRQLIPLGFASWIYDARSKGVDFITYARVLRDTGKILKVDIQLLVLGGRTHLTLKAFLFLEIG
jgi:hypothetical protein